MKLTIKVLCELGLFLLLTNCVNCVSYEILQESDEIFYNCENPSPPAGVLNMHGLMDLSNMKYERKNEVDSDRSVSGNSTTIWDVQPTDRIRAYWRLYKYGNGAMRPTMLGNTINDFCKVFFKKDEPWYNFWSQYIRGNRDNMCFNKRGQTYVLDPYELSFRFDDASVHNLSGLYKIVMKFEAYDEKQRVVRPTSICFELRGELKKL